MTPEELFKEIDDYCRANGDEAIVKKYARYFKGDYNAFGLTHEQTTSKIKSLFEGADIDLNLVFRTAPLLLRTGKYEETSFALHLLMSFKKEFSIDTFHEFERWFETGITNWAHADFISGEVMQVFFKKEIITFHDLDKWRVAKNKFQRRAVPVSLIKELKKTTDYQPYLDFIEPLMMDAEREVHQGLGWFLREAWKRQPSLVEPFLYKWKNKAPRLIFQYATEKMTPDEKQRFRKEK
jgi:3-methyladenine DNA glycosylase AlkD